MNKKAVIIITIIVLLILISMSNNFTKENYDKCMNYTNGNTNVCDKLK